MQSLEKRAEKENGWIPATKSLCVAFMPTIGNGEDKVPKEDRTICEAITLLY